MPYVRLPGGVELQGPSTGEVSRALGIGRELAAREVVDLLVVGAGPAGLGAAVYGASEGLDTLVIDSTALGGQAGSSRRIENYLGFPAGITGTELTSRAVTQARKFNARTATPYRAISLEPGNGRHVVRLEDDHEVAAGAVLLATGAQYRRLPVDGLGDYEGISIFYAAGPPEAQLCGAARVGVVGRRQLSRAGRRMARARRRARDPAPPARRPARDDVGLSRPRARTLRRRGARPQRDRRPARGGRAARGGHAREREATAVLASCSCSSARNRAPIGSTTPSRATMTASSSRALMRAAEALLETSVPGVFAAGDVRSGSTKRCATAVGEGAMAVQLVHGHLAEPSLTQRSTAA